MIHTSSDLFWSQTLIRKWCEVQLDLNKRYQVEKSSKSHEQRSNDVEGNGNRFCLISPSNHQIFILSYSRDFIFPASWSHVNDPPVASPRRWQVRQQQVALRASFNWICLPPNEFLSTHRRLQPWVVGQQLIPFCWLGDRCEAALGYANLTATLQILVYQLLTSRFTNCFGWHGSAWSTTFSSLAFFKSHTKYLSDERRTEWWNKEEKVKFWC